MSGAPRVLVVTEEPGWHGAELRRALEAHGAAVSFASLRACRLELGVAAGPIVVPGMDGLLPDGVLVRDVPGGSLEQVVLRLDLLHALREYGVPVYNDARTIERTVDKAMSSLLLRRAGLPTPPTCVTESPVEAATFISAEAESGHEVVVKPLFGSLGVGLRRLGPGAALPDAAEYGGVWYLQRYIDTGAGGQGFSDFRALVVAGATVAAMIRRGTGWVSNVAQGARCEPCPPDAALETLAAAAAAAVGADYAGVDLVRDAAGQLQVLEVNGIPAWRGLQGTTAVDLAARVAGDFITRRLGLAAAVVE